jgi:hypothetical protein
VPKEKTASDELAEILKDIAAVQRRGKRSDGTQPPAGWYDRAAARRDELLALPPEPPKPKQAINRGDWVTPNRQYAKEHGESALNGEYEIISKKVRAKDIYTNGDSIHEFGYDPSP